MASVGKCLLFYLKYPAEMERLYQAEEPNLEGLPDSERTLKRIRLVGDRAQKDAAEFLEACAPGIESHFGSISACERVRNRLERSWELKFRISPEEVGSIGEFEVGVLIRQDRAALIPWVWRRGGRRAEDEMLRILKMKTKLSAPSDWAAGSIMLAEFKLLNGGWDEPIPRDPLVDRVQEAFKSFTKDKIKAIAAIANRRDE